MLLMSDSYDRFVQTGHNLVHLKRSLDVYFGLMRSTNLISFQGPVALASDVLLMLLESESFETTELPVL